MSKIKIPEEIDLEIAQIMMEYDQLRYRVGNKPEDYLETVYQIYDILRDAGAEL